MLNMQIKDPDPETETLLYNELKYVTFPLIFTFLLFQ